MIVATHLSCFPELPSPQTREADFFVGIAEGTDCAAMRQRRAAATRMGPTCKWNQNAAHGAAHFLALRLARIPGERF